MSYKLLLPELSVSKTGGHGSAAEKILLIAGGRKPSADWLKAAARQRIIYCADRGLDICLQAQLRPDCIIGDGDSADKVNWQWARKSGAVFEEFPADKDLTDTQLALRTIIARHGNADILVTGIWGGRFDHLYSGIFSMSSLADSGVNICAADEKETLLYLKNATALAACSKIPVSISLLPLSSTCKGVSIGNVKWPLDNVLLRQDHPYAISNVLQESNDLNVTVGEGLAGIYFCWDNR